jgi:hypothetical protein
LNPFLGKGVGLGVVRVAGQGAALAVEGVGMVAELVVDEVADCEVDLDPSCLVRDFAGGAVCVRLSMSLESAGTKKAAVVPETAQISE